MFYFQILFSNTTQVELLTNSFNDPILKKKKIPGKITETKSRTSFQPNYLGRAIFFTNFLFSSFAWPGLSDWLYQKWMQWTRSLASCFDLNGFYACECCYFQSISSLLKSIGLKNRNSQNSNTFEWFSSNWKSHLFSLTLIDIQRNVVWKNLRN